MAAQRLASSPDPHSFSYPSINPSTRFPLFTSFRVTVGSGAPPKALVRVTLSNTVSDQYKVHK